MKRFRSLTLGAAFPVLSWFLAAGATLASPSGTMHRYANESLYQAGISYYANLQHGKDVYNSLSASYLPAARAGYYSAQRDAAVSYYVSLASYYGNLGYAIGFQDLTNLAAIVSQYNAVKEAYYDATDDVFSAYGPYTSALSWGGNYDDQIALYGHEAQSAIALEGRIMQQVASYFSGYAFWKLYCEGLANGLSGTYNYYGDQFFQIYAKAGDFAGGSAKADEFRELAVSTSGVYYAYAEYYDLLSTKFED